MCESMKPGTTIMPPASMTLVSDVTIFFTSALEPTTLRRSPTAAMASAQGRRRSPVQTRAFTTASVGGPEAGRGGRVMRRMIAYRRTSRPLPGRLVTLPAARTTRRATFHAMLRPGTSTTTTISRIRAVALLLAAWLVFFVLLATLSFALAPSGAARQFDFGGIEITGAVVWTALSLAIASYHRRLRTAVPSLLALIAAHVPMLVVAAVADALSTSCAVLAFTGTPSRL